MLDFNQSTLLEIRSLDCHTPQLSLNLPDPVLLFMRRSIAECDVHVFQGLPSCLRDKKVCESTCQETKDREKYIRPPLYGGEHIGGDETNNKVTHPGRGGSYRDSF